MEHIRLLKNIRLLSYWFMNIVVIHTPLCANSDPFVKMSSYHEFPFIQLTSGAIYRYISLLSLPESKEPQPPPTAAGRCRALYVN